MQLAFLTILLNMIYILNITQIGMRKTKMCDGVKKGKLVITKVKVSYTGKMAMRELRRKIAVLEASFALAWK